MGNIELKLVGLGLSMAGHPISFWASFCPFILSPINNKSHFIIPETNFQNSNFAPWPSFIFPHQYFS